MSIFSLRSLSLYRFDLLVLADVFDVLFSRIEEVFPVLVLFVESLLQGHAVVPSTYRF